MSIVVGRHSQSTTHRLNQKIHIDVTCLVRKLLVSDNEFGCDVSSHGDYHDESSDNIDDDIFEQLKFVPKMRFDTLMRYNDNNILFESLLRIYLSSKHGYIDIAAILTTHNLYFLSAINYQIWLKLKERTKIDEVMDTEDSKIDNEAAIQLSDNLNLIDNDKVTKTKIIPYFIGKSLKEIKLSIVSEKYD
eukprot:528011_1